MNETTMSAYEAITTRRSVRRFLDRAVPPESVHQILRGAAQSPSGHNIQPWKVYVVSGVTKQKVKRPGFDDCSCYWVTASSAGCF
jgi:nitroreductase